MIYLVFPVNSFSGWGVCGKYLVRELSKFTEVRLVTEDILKNYGYIFLKEMYYQILVYFQIDVRVELIL